MLSQNMSWTRIHPATFPRRFALMRVEKWDCNISSGSCCLRLRQACCNHQALCGWRVCSDYFSTAGLGLFVFVYTAFPQHVSSWINEWHREEDVETVDRAPRCGLLASQEIIKIITVACANSVQVLRHNTRWDRAPHASSQGPGSSRLPWEPAAPSFLSLLLCTLPPF